MLPTYASVVRTRVIQAFRARPIKNPTIADKNDRLGVSLAFDSDDIKRVASSEATRARENWANITANYMRSHSPVRWYKPLQPLCSY